MKKTTKSLLLILIPPLILFIIVMLWVRLGLQIRIDYTNSNGMTAIEARTVPTIINGIATVTSIIIGFSGTAVGLLIKNFLEDISKGKEALLIVLILPFAGSLGILYNAYIELSMGGQGFLELAWRDALTAMVVAFFSLLFILLWFNYQYSHQK
jgi:hypothetical protein